MTMTACRECGEEVSNKAKSCPHCGVKNPGKKKQKGIGWGPGCLIIIGLFVVFAILNPNKDYNPPVRPTEVRVDEGSPMEVTLASIDQHSPVVSRQLVGRYAALLDRLNGRCPESRTMIGDMAARTKELVASNYGRDVTIMKVLQEVDVATAPPVDSGPTCSEVFALIAILLGEL